MFRVPWYVLSVVRTLALYDVSLGVSLPRLCTSRVGNYGSVSSLAGPIFVMSLSVLWYCIDGIDCTRLGNDRNRVLAIVESLREKVDHGSW